MLLLAWTEDLYFGNKIQFLEVFSGQAEVSKKWRLGATELMGPARGIALAIACPVSITPTRRSTWTSSLPLAFCALLFVCEFELGFQAHDLGDLEFGQPCCQPVGARLLVVGHTMSWDFRAFRLEPSWQPAF